MDIITHWSAVKLLFAKSFTTSFHYAIATVNQSATPHVTPIGSLILTTPGKGFYFEKFTRQMPINAENNKYICVLAVNSSRWYWFTSLIIGRFSSPPAVRLMGVLGERRHATVSEITKFQRRVFPLKFTKGYKKLWGDMTMVRELHFTAIEPIRIGAMTKNNWGNS